MKKILFILSVLFFSGSALFAGPERSSTTDAVFTDNGNKIVCREVKMSTSAAVVLSSAPASSGYGNSAWRKRTITNMSTSSVMGIYPSDTTNTTYDYSDGITLSSMTTSNPVKAIGNTQEFFGQYALKAIWNVIGGTIYTPSSLISGRGALVCEEYWE